MPKIMADHNVEGHLQALVNIWLSPEWGDVWSDLNSYLERYFGSLKSECLDRMIFFGEKSLYNAIRQYLVHYQGSRNHQGLENRIIEPGEEVGQCEGVIQCRERLGGLLRYYYRDAT